MATPPARPDTPKAHARSNQIRRTIDSSLIEWTPPRQPRADEVKEVLIANPTRAILHDAAEPGNGPSMCMYMTNFFLCEHQLLRRVPHYGVKWGVCVGTGVCGAVAAVRGDAGRKYFPPQRKSADISERASTAQPIRY